jgi:hypothetical protein
MRASRIAGIAVVTLFTVTPSAFAQTQTKSSDTATQTFTGCLMTEPAYRKAHNLGAGALGGAGLGDEFVLVDVKVSPAKDMPAAMSSTKTSSTKASASASTCADQGLAYRLNGTAEEKLKGLVGRQLEIQGRLKHSADVAANGTRTDEKLPAEVVIVSFREAPIETAMSEPAPVPSSTVEPARPTEPARTVAPPPPTPEPAPAAPARSTEPRTMPRTASSSGLVGLIGVLALSSGLALAVIRRRAAIGRG